jgi:hypothetical protein
LRSKKLLLQLRLSLQFMCHSSRKKWNSQPCLKFHQGRSYVLGAGCTGTQSKHGFL